MHTGPPRVAAAFGAVHSRFATGTATLGARASVEWGGELSHHGILSDAVCEAPSSERPGRSVPATLCRHDSGTVIRTWGQRAREPPPHPAGHTLNRKSGR